MSEKKVIKRGISRDEWVLEGLEVLNESGVDQVTIHNLARRLGVARSGFYWHFKDRNALHEAMLIDWERLMTKTISDNKEIASLGPIDRLLRIAELIQDFDLNAYDVALNHWAMQSKMAARRVRAVTRLRFRFVKRAFAELGFEGEALELRTMLFVTFTMWEGTTFSNIPQKKRQAMNRKRVELLTRAD
ncbi:MAG: TetR/AcrR family transcriptional regulator [Gammaproteobacteria bacterium]|nr:TetR/AcrR family transcriptional regulator [Gammaproteobacteria bacterium]